MPDRTDHRADEQRLRSQLDRLTAERLDCWLEVAEKRTTIAALTRRVAELERQAADHPSEVATLTAECEAWAARAGAAEADLDAVKAECESEHVDAEHLAGTILGILSRPMVSR